MKHEGLKSTMKKSSLSLLLCLLSTAATPALAQAFDSPPALRQSVVDDVFEKRVLGQLYPGNRPMIPVDQATSMATPALSLTGAIQTVSQPAGVNPVLKTYAVKAVDANAPYQSHIEIKDAQGKVLSTLNVGRRIHRLLPSPTRNRLYVLCGGYFGSVWEIDTQRDIVLRKLPAYTPGISRSTLWNPYDMALSKDGSTLAVGSGKLQTIDLRTGQLQHEVDLPEAGVMISNIAAAGNTFQVKVRMANGQQSAYQLNTTEAKLEPSGFSGGNAYHPHQVKVRTATMAAPAASRQLFMASRNADFIRMVDRQTLGTTGVLPVDFPVDDLVLSPDRQKLFAYHRRFGQVTVIDLNGRSPHQFSTIKRFRDPRFKRDFELASAVDSVYLWNGKGDIFAAFSQDTLYPKVGIPFGVKLLPEAERQVWVSRPAHQRYYLRAGNLYSDYLEQGPARSNAGRVALSSPVKDFLMSPDRRSIYALTHQAELIKIDATTQAVQQRLALGMNPGSISLSPDGRRLIVADQDRGSLKEVSMSSFKVTREVVMDMADDQVYQITLFDPRLTQIIEIELPRFAENMVRVRS